MSWRHVCESGGAASVSLNLSTVPTYVLGGKSL